MRKLTNIRLVAALMLTLGLVFGGALSASAQIGEFALTINVETDDGEEATDATWAVLDAEGEALADGDITGASDTYAVDGVLEAEQTYTVVVSATGYVDGAADFDVPPGVVDADVTVTLVADVDDDNGDNGVDDGVDNGVDNGDNGVDDGVDNGVDNGDNGVDDGVDAVDADDAADDAVDAVDATDADDATELPATGAGTTSSVSGTTVLLFGAMSVMALAAAFIAYQRRQA